MNQKSNFYYNLDITPKRVTSGGIPLRGSAPAQHSSEETSQWWRLVGDTVSDLTDTGIEPKTFRAGNNVFNHYFKVNIVNFKENISDLEWEISSNFHEKKNILQTY